MDHLEAISMADLRRALENVEGKKPVQRLITAIAYKNGITQTELAEWYDVERRTIYNWLKRLDTDGSLESAVTDIPRPGRSRKLTDEQRIAFERTVNEPPAKAGYDASVWTTSQVQQYLEETYGVEYSRPSCRRLLKEAGLGYRKLRDGTTGSDQDRLSGIGDGFDRSEGGWVPR